MTEQNIQENKYQLSGNEPENVSKNRYLDILPCKRLFRAVISVVG